MEKIADNKEKKAWFTKDEIIMFLLGVAIGMIASIIIVNTVTN